MRRASYVVDQIRASDVILGDVIRRGGTWGLVTEIGPSESVDYPELICIKAEGQVSFNHKAYDLVDLQVCAQFLNTTERLP